jgi:ribosomal protein S18 acetylase RimI-like enzyme
VTKTRTPTPTPQLQWIDDHHPQEVQALSRRCFGIDEAMSEKFVMDFMDLVDHVPKVLVLGKKVVGYNFYVLHRKVVTIQQLAVGSEYRRRGYATRMLNDLKESLPGLRRRIIAVEVCETNLDAQLLLRENKFDWFKTLSGEGERPDRYAFKYTARK